MRNSFFVLVLFVVSVAGMLAAQTHPRHHKAKIQSAPAQPAPQPVQPAVQPPAPPPTPENGPPSPPDVNMRGGQLTITARNSTLSDVLNAVKQKTGAAVDMPAASGERVVGKFGPGAPREVMAQLLNGSHYDYVLLGSANDPGALNKIVLTARAIGPEPPAQQQPQQGFQPQQAFQQNLQAVPQVETDQAPDTSVNNDVVPEQPPEEEPQEQPEQMEQSEQPEQPQPGQNGPVVKTPEQLLRELQQQQQQQQQQMQNGQPGPPER